MHNAADDAPIVHPFDASHIPRQMRLDPLPLLIAQPKQVPPHDPDPPNESGHMESGLLCHSSKINEFSA
jgi:hypothetical protein